MAERVAIILAGGSGERFWPASTPSRPKQLLNLHDPDRSLLQEAFDRLAPMFGRSNIFVATGPAIAGAIRDSGVFDEGNVIEEPGPRNTLPAICWAHANLKIRGFDAETLVAVVTADHAIEPEQAFRDTVRAALDTAEGTGGLVTIGIRPTRPETGYGYIETGHPQGVASTVKRFHEKPDAATAYAYSSCESFLWNSGMFFWKVADFDRELALADSQMSGVNDRLPGDLSLFDQLEKVSVDKGLMEKSERIFVVQAQFEWDDLGSWDALDRSSTKDEHGNVAAGQVKLVQVSNSIVQASPGLNIGVVGLDNVIVIATENGILVCTKDQAQRVREVKF